tara:strand:+ start:467 stop:766 length:300 start_codon:yes stop_codon:yes gene_type:complete
MASVSIEHVDRMHLLRNLWFSACLSNGVDVHAWNLQRALLQLQVNGFAERICGISLKVQLFNANCVDATLYDAMYGHGRFQQVVDFTYSRSRRDASDER